MIFLINIYTFPLLSLWDQTKLIHCTVDHFALVKYFGIDTLIKGPHFVHIQANLDLGLVSLVLR